MDVTPQLIEQIDFSEKFRGYDPDQVDDFLERVGATIAELSRTARDATQRAERAESELEALKESGPVAAPAPVAAPVPAVMSDEEEAMQSTRTLMMAKRTADAAIADAREEAQRLVEAARTTADQTQREAQTEADRIVGEARVNADQMTQKATAEANREYGGRRDQILAEIGDLENRKVGMVGQIVAMETRIEEYRGSLTGIHGAIGGILADPEAMLRAPIPGLDVAALSAAAPVAPVSVPEPPVAEPVQARVEVDPEPALAAAAFADPEPSADVFAPAVADDDDDAFRTVAFDAAGAFGTGGDAFGTGGDAFGEGERESDRAFGDPIEAFGRDDAFGDATLLDPGDLAVPYESDAGSALATADLAWPEHDGEPATDPWGPGTWGEVSAFADEPEALAEGVPFEADPGSSNSFGEFPTDGLPVIGQDRYTRDLDQAVNQPQESQDDAMTAFFEGDDDPQTRRFGRRR